MRGLCKWAKEAKHVTIIRPLMSGIPNARKAPAFPFGRKATLSGTVRVGLLAQKSAFGLFCCLTPACGQAHQLVLRDALTPQCISLRAIRFNTGIDAPLPELCYLQATLVQMAG
jgi:hypothetical protein